MTRAFFLSGARTGRQFLALIFGAGGVELHSALPTHMLRFARAWYANGDETTAAAAIDRLTSAPYYSWTGTAEQAFHVKTRMIGPNGPYSQIGLLASPIRSTTVLRYCTRCARHDHEVFGTSHWHREHQLPLVEVCGDHGIALHDILPASGRKDARVMVLPPTSPVALLPNQSSSSRGLAWSLLSRESLERPPSRFDPGAIVRTYRRRLREMGFAQRGTLIDRRKFLNAFVDHHAGFRFLGGPRFGTALETTESNWAMRLVRKPRARQHPAMHLLLIAFLFDDWSSFLKALDAPSPLAAPLHTRESDKVARGLRHHEAEGSRSRSIVVQRFASGDALPDIARDFKLSTGHLYKLAREDPTALAERREALFDIVRANHRRRFTSAALGVPTNRRAMTPASYTWLHRHDREWLASQLSTRNQLKPTTRVDWSCRDRELSEAVAREARTLLASTAKPVRVTLAELARRTNSANLLEKKRRLLPVTSACLNTWCETTSDFQLRRVVWAVIFLERAQSPLTRSRIARLAGVPSTAAWLERAVFEASTSLARFTASA